MWKDKKFIVIGSLLVVLIAVVSTLGGLALARQYDRNIGPIQLTRIEAPSQEKDMSPGDVLNEALDKYLDKLVEDGTITQDEADQFKSWWESKPDIEGIFNFFNNNQLNLFERMHQFSGGAAFGFIPGK
ncbi:MAG: hypothetical protein PHG35_02980 [Dehalococcoidales bacterium]|nr:hypothetical protein [Dehalococcoidales bacterium]